MRRAKKTISILSNLYNKKLIAIVLEVEDKLKPEDEVIPVKKSGFFAVSVPINGEKNIEFYKKIDNRKDFATIVKEIDINYNEGRDILKYLQNQGRISLRKKK